MAKRGIRSYRLIANSRFRPMTYDEILSPALMQTQAHQALEAQYADLASKANELEKKLDANRDKVSRATYEKYMSDLDSIATKLTKFGLTQGSNRDALAANSEYHKRIIPIIEGYNRRAEAERQQQAMLAQDPTRLFNRMASELSVDDFVADQTLDVISQNYSGAMITKQVADQGLQYVKWAKKNGKLHSLGIPYKYEQEFQQGASPEAVYAAMMKDPNADPFFQRVVDQVLQSTGISKWSSVNGDVNSYNWKRADNYAREGLPAFIGTRTWKTYDDNYNMQLSLMKQRPGSGSGTDYQYRGMQSNPNYLYSTYKVDVLEKAKDKGWITKGKDGKWHLTDSGKAAAYSPKAGFNDLGIQPSDFGSIFLGEDGKTMAEYAKSKGRKLPNGQYGITNEDWDNLLNDALNNYEGFGEPTDAYQEVVHDLYLNPAQQAAWKDRIGEKRLSRAEYLGKGKGYRTGSAANPNELDDIDWKTVTPTRIRTSRYGNTILLQDKEGNRFEYMLPQNINQTFEGPIQQHIQSYYDAVDIGSKGYYPETNADGTYKRDKNGNIVFSDRKMTDEQRAAWGAFTDEQYQPVDQYYANIGGTWGVKPSEFQYGMIPTDAYNSVSTLPWYMMGGYNDNEEE